MDRAWMILSDPKELPRIFALSMVFVFLIALFLSYSYNPDQLYPKSFELSGLYPYDRGGEPLTEPAKVVAQYPQNAEKIGWVTSYLTPLSSWLASKTLYLGTTIVSHPGGIIDEILYYTRGLDTVLESSILMMAFLIASFLMKLKRG
ncbi:MAG: EhaF family protein [Archaeoglobi archaeon]|nr:EhaF family protein [Candidatus Mnemosynella bozhongmuii]